jgi:DNA-binding MarR family transcriptional regulator
MVRSSRARPPAPADLDPLIHERLRLGIVSALAAHEPLSFTELRDLLRATDGNLSVQARRLEEAGYVICQKRFEDRKPKTTYRLTAKGRGALEQYLATLADMLPPIKAARGAAASRRSALRPIPSEG